ncbi:MAG: BatD family protein [Bacteroidetes bacterium]|nr:BatD family protein [Bacteroidota bacterium]
MNNNIYMVFRRFLLVVGFLTIFAAGFSQDVSFQGSAKSTVSIGESFTLTYTLNSQGGDFRGPRLNGFDVISGPFTSTSSSIQSVNGRTTMSVRYSFQYILQANKEGTFDIPPATVTVDRRTITSNSVAIKVVRNAAGQPGGNSGQSSGNSQQQGNVQTNPNDVMLKAYVSNTNPLQGEGISVTYKIFTKVPVSQIMFSKEPSFPGFWSQNLTKEKEKLQQYTQVIDGQQYIVADLRKYTLFPLKSGKLIIEPLELVCQAQIKRQSKSRTGDPFFDDFFNDSFFNTSYTPVEKSLRASPLNINVRPLPASGVPEDFAGAVGNFNFHTELDRTKVKTNEAINLKCVVSGEGNLQLIDKLNITFPPDFETYDPKISNDLRSSEKGVSGSQVFEYLIIPRKPGKFNLKPISFSFYDLKKMKYITLTSPEYTIEVEKGSGEAANVTYTGANHEEIKYIGSDIRHIKNQVFALSTGGNYFFGSPAFILWLILPLVVFVTFVLLFRKFSERRSDVVLMKNLRATKVARKRLRKAEIYFKEQKQKEFYVEISQALWGYLSDKFSLPIAELSIDTVRQTLISKEVGEELIQNFLDTLNNTEFARFAPGEKSDNMERIYNEALAVISRIERELR